MSKPIYTVTFRVPLDSSFGGPKEEKFEGVSELIITPSQPPIATMISPLGQPIGIVVMTPGTVVSNKQESSLVTGASYETH